MNELTPEKLAELRRMLDAATPRPWMACEDEDEVLIVLDDDSNHWPGRYTAIARGFEQGDDYGLSDAMLVTAAVNALPALLDAATELAHMTEARDNARARVAELESERDAMAAAWDEGHEAGHEDARAVQSTYPEPTPNPYRTEGDSR